MGAPQRMDARAGSAFFSSLLGFTRIIQPSYGSAGIQGLAIAVLPLALAAVAQAIVVISGGIDLSIGSMMALTSVVAATLMKASRRNSASSSWLGVLLLGLVLGADQRRARGADPGAGHRRHARHVVRLGRMRAARPAATRRRGGRLAPATGQGPIGNEWIPKAAVAWLVIVAVIWIPLRRSRLGLSLYAIGSNQLAAFRSGVSIGRTKLIAYAIGGLFAALGGLSLTASTGIGTPVPGPYTLLSVAAIVLGGVSLAGGRGGVVGPIVAVMILSADPHRHDVPAREHEPGDGRAGRDPDRGRDGRQPHPDRRERARMTDRRRHHTAAPQPWTSPPTAGVACSATGRSSRCWSCWRSSWSPSGLLNPDQRHRVGRGHAARGGAARDPGRLPDPRRCSPAASTCPSGPSRR